MKNILVGVNHTKQSPTLLHYALKLAQFFNASITAAHIIESSSYRVSDGDLLQSKLTIEEINDRKEAIKQEEITLLKGTLKRLMGKQFEGITTDVKAEFGVPKEELSEIARETAAELMVIYSQTASKFLTWLFGDESRAIINNSPCPVLLVPGYVEYHGFNRLVYATDFLFDDLEALFYLQKWASAYRAQLLCIHVCKKEEDKAVAEQKMATLKKIFPNIETQIFTGEVVNSIDNYLKLTRADLVATTTKKRDFWQSVFQPSVTSQLGENSSLPVLIFKERK